ncbi:hypothetical protein KFD70_21940 [Bacillus pfraonensis]|uniref:hypothetical protein n=1 Tax=Bacillus pfraonensis TaxID=2830844 RepID=UPI003D701418
MTNKANYTNEDIEGYIYPKLGDYEAVSFCKDGNQILVLGISGPALANHHCGLQNVDVYRWLWDKGNGFINELEESEKLMIKHTDVSNGELTVHWTNLDKMQDSYL